MSADLAQIKVIGVLGAGQMGAGIAQVAATVGYQVLMADVNIEQANKGKAGIDKILTRNVSKERITEVEKAEILSRLTPVNGLSELSGADFVIEAATENEGLKLKLFAQLDEHCASHAILATNTSSIPITRIAAATNRPHKVIGMHFMNPVPVMTLVEIIHGLQTSDATHQKTLDLCRRMGKDPATSNDVPGFIGNRA